MRAETLDRFTEAFGRAASAARRSIPCYGMAEATLIVTGGYKQAAAGDPHVRRAGAGEQPGRSMRWPTRQGSRRWSAAAATLLDRDRDRRSRHADAAAAPTEVGEIWVSGPSVAQGYWNRAEETRAHVPARI